MLLEVLGELNNAGPQPIIHERPLDCLWFEGGLRTRWWARVKGRGPEARRSPRSVFAKRWRPGAITPTQVFLPQ